MCFLLLIICCISDEGGNEAHVGACIRCCGKIPEGEVGSKTSQHQDSSLFWQKYFMNPQNDCVKYICMCVYSLSSVYGFSSMYVCVWCQSLYGNVCVEGCFCFVLLMTVNSNAVYFFCCALLDGVVVVDTTRTYF